MIPVIDRYVMKEVTKTLLAFMLVLMLVVVGTGFIRYLEKVALGDIAAQILFQVLGVELLRYLGVLVPPAFFLAVLLTLGRMHRDSEIIAMESCGIGPLRIFRSVLVGAIPVAALVAWLSLFVLPWGNQTIQIIKHRASGAVAELAGVDEGKFNEYSKGDLVFYIEELDTGDKQMSNVFVQNREHGKVGLVTAAGGYPFKDPETGEQYLVLNDGRRYEGRVGAGDFRIGEFEKYGIRLSQRSTEPVQQRRKAMPTRSLLTSQSLKDRAEIQYRLSQPLAVFAFALLSIPLSRSLPRHGVYGRMIFAFLVYFIFLNLQGVAENLMEDELTPAWMGMWWVPVSMVMVAGAMMLPETTQGRSLLRKLFRERKP